MALLGLLFLLPTSVSLPDDPPADSPPWIGEGHFRILVEVPPMEVGTRPEDEMPAEIALDFTALFQPFAAGQRPDIGSLQVIGYDAASGRPQEVSDYAYGRSPYDLPFRWLDAAVPYDFAEFMGSINQTNGEIRRQNRARGGYFYGAIGDWHVGHLVWRHREKRGEKRTYAVYFDLLPAGRMPDQNPPAAWLGDGLPRFDRAGATSTGCTHVAIDIDDWDGDGLPDLVFGEDYGHLFWFRNAGTHGSPRFPVYRMLLDQLGAPVDAGMALVPLVIDWNRDGAKDLLAGSHWNRVLFFKNEGTDQNRKLAYQGFLKIDGEPFALPVTPLVHGSPQIFKEDYYPVLEDADWDGDGDIDLLAGGYITGRIYFYETTGYGTDGAPLLRLKGPLEADGKAINVGEWCAAPCAADFDGDGDLDLISGRYSWKARGSEDFLRYYENVGERKRPELRERSFPKSGQFPFLNLALPRAVDWDHDGDIDLVVSTSGGDIYLLENIGGAKAPSFRMPDRPLPSQWMSAPLPGTGAYISTQFLDWNKDGFLDVVSNYAAYLNSGKARPGSYETKVDVLPPGLRIAHPSGTGDDWFWPRLYDLDQDGKLDVIFGDWGGHIWFHRNLSDEQTNRFDETGHKLKTSEGIDIQVGPVGKDPTKEFVALQGARTVFTMADFDRDKLLDVVVGDTFGIVRYYRNQGPKDNPVFAPPVEVCNTKTRGMVDSVDWDGDGWIDILVGSAGVRDIYLFRNLGGVGQIAFAPAPAPRIPPIIEPRVVAVDLNQDGDMDLFAPSTQGSCFVERSFMEHGYAPAKLIRIEKKP